MVLKREDMQWVLENDEGVQGEILEAVKKSIGELQRAKSESMRQRSSNGGSSKNVFDAWMQPSPSGPTRFAPQGSMGGSAAGGSAASGAHRSSAAAAGGSGTTQSATGVRHVSSFGEVPGAAQDALNWALDEGVEEDLSMRGQGAAKAAGAAAAAAHAANKCVFALSALSGLLPASPRPVLAGSAALCCSADVVIMMVGAD